MTTQIVILCPDDNINCHFENAPSSDMDSGTTIGYRMEQESLQGGEP